MKKFIILLALMLNLVPHFNNKGSLTFGPFIVNAAYGDEDSGSEEDTGDDTYDDTGDDSYDNSSDNSYDDSSNNSSNQNNQSNDNSSTDNSVDVSTTTFDDGSTATVYDHGDYTVSVFTDADGTMTNITYVGPDGVVNSWSIDNSPDSPTVSDPDIPLVDQTPDPDPEDTEDPDSANPPTPPVQPNLDCPCIKNLTSKPTGGLLRNEKGDILYSTSGQLTGNLLGYPSNYMFTYESVMVWASDGTPMTFIQIEGLTINGVSVNSENYSYNCLGYALADGEFIVGAEDYTDINKLLGISSVSSAISDGTITIDANCTNIQPGDVLLIFDENNKYVHAAKYEGGGLYSTKNGTGAGVQNWTLQQIKDLYYKPDMGGTKCGYTKAPPENSNPSNLGIDDEGHITVDDFIKAIDHCKCDN